MPIARAAAPSPAAATAATWLFAAGVLSNVVIGRMPFTLGIALAVAAWLCAERERPRGGSRPPCWRSRACWRAPWPGAFLVLAAAARAAGPAAATLGRAAVLALPVTVGGGTMAGLFPEGGDDRFVATAFWPMLAVALAAARCWRPPGARCGSARCSTSASSSRRS